MQIINYSVELGIIKWRLSKISEPLLFNGKGTYPAGGGVEMNPGDHRESPTTTMKQMSNTDEISILETRI